VQAAGLFGLLVSVLAWSLVAIATPAPFYLTDMAMVEALVLENRVRLPIKAA
jgi:hypothetical protein